MKIAKPRISQLFALAFAALATGPGCGVITTTENGNRVGVVVGLHQQGVMCVTWEGELAMGGIRGGGQSGSNSLFSFHVEDPKVIKELQDAMDHLKTVKVTYNEVAMPWACRQSNADTITKVEVMDTQMPLAINPMLSQSEKDLNGGGQPVPLPPGQVAPGDVLMVCRPVKPGEAAPK